MRTFQSHTPKRLSGPQRVHGANEMEEWGQGGPLGGPLGPGTRRTGPNGRTRVESPPRGQAWEARRGLARRAALRVKTGCETWLCMLDRRCSAELLKGRQGKLDSHCLPRAVGMKRNWEDVCLVTWCRSLAGFCYLIFPRSGNRSWSWNVLERLVPDAKSACRTQGRQPRPTRVERAGIILPVFLQSCAIIYHVGVVPLHIGMMRNK